MRECILTPPPFYIISQSIAEDVSEHTHGRHRPAQGPFAGTMEDENYDSLCFFYRGAGTSTRLADNVYGVNLGPANRTISFRNHYALDPTGAVFVRLRRVYGVWMPVTAAASIGPTNYAPKYLTIVAAGVPTFQRVDGAGGVPMRPQSVIQYIDLMSPYGTSKTLVHCLFVLYSRLPSTVHLLIPCTVFLFFPFVIFAVV